MKRIAMYRGSLILLVLYILVMLYFMLVLPADAQVPMHWNAQGEIDSYYAKTPALLVGLGLEVFLFLLIYLMPYYSPKYRNQAERFEKVLPGLCFVLMLFFALINIYSLLLAKVGDAIPINIIFVLIGLLFIFLGNLLPKVPRNFFIGIRTPWTIMDVENWHRTHRLGAYLFVISGIIMILKGVILIHHSIFQNISMILALALLLYPLLHSFLLFRKKGA